MANDRQIYHLISRIYPPNTPLWKTSNPHPSNPLTDSPQAPRRHVNSPRSNESHTKKLKPRSKNLKKTRKKQSEIMMNYLPYWSGSSRIRTTRNSSHSSRHSSKRLCHHAISSLSLPSSILRRRYICSQSSASMRIYHSSWLSIDTKKRRYSMRRHSIRVSEPG